MTEHIMTEHIMTEHIMTEHKDYINVKKHILQYNTLT